MATVNAYGYTEQTPQELADYLASARALMATQGSNYILQGDSDPTAAAQLPQMLEQNNIPVTQGFKDNYQDTTGQQWQSGTTTTFNPGTGYSVTGGTAPTPAPTPAPLPSPAPTPVPAPAPAAAAPASPFVIGGTSPGIINSALPTTKSAPDVHTPGNPERSASILTSWNTNKGNPAEVMNLMSQYGVSMSELSTVTGIPVSQLASQLGAPSGFMGYTAPPPAAPTPAPSASAPDVHTPGNPARSASILSFWNQYKSNPQTLMQAMSQFGVSMKELSDLTGIPQSQLAQQLGAPAGFGGYAPPTSTSTDLSSVYTPGNPDRSASILTSWNTNKNNPSEVVKLMSQYGVSISELSSVTGIPVAQLAQQLGMSTDGGSSTPAGIINSGMASQWNIDGSQTVAGQLKDLLNPNNPLMQQARTGALEQMNNRGLSNSSMAMTAGDAAAYQAALPIAQADAATYAKATSYNADQKNQFALQGNNLSSSQWIAQLQANTSKYNTDASAATSKYNTDVGASTSKYSTDANSNTSKYTADLSSNTQQAIAAKNVESQQIMKQWDNATQLEGTRIQQAYQQQINTNSQASTAFNNAMQFINQINLQSTMSPEVKTQAIAEIYRNLQSQLNTLSAVTGLDVKSQLNFAGQPGFNNQGIWKGFDSKGATLGVDASGNDLAPGAAPPVVAPPTPTTPVAPPEREQGGS